MNESLKTTDWTATRGEKWRAQLAGMEAMMAPIDEPLTQALHLDAPFRIADIGCGGGGTAIEIARRAPAGSVIHGFDVSPALIEMARSRTPGDERAIAFEVADMSTVPPSAAPYDRLVSRFGIMFFDDPPAAFANLSRWLAPGGRFAFAVWGEPAANPWMTTVRQVVAEVISPAAPDPDAPGPFRYGEAGRLVTLLDRAGFGELAVSHWQGALRLGGGLASAEAADFALASFSTFGELLAAAGGEALQRARERLTARLMRHEQEGTVRMDASVHIVTGVRPD